MVFSLTLKLKETQAPIVRAGRTPHRHAKTLPDVFKEYRKDYEKRRRPSSTVL
jgi:hypothetical protein